MSSYNISFKYIFVSYHLFWELMLIAWNTRAKFWLLGPIIWMASKFKIAASQQIFLSNQTVSMYFCCILHEASLTFFLTNTWNLDLLAMFCKRNTQVVVMLVLHSNVMMLLLCRMLLLKYLQSKNILKKWYIPSNRRSFFLIYHEMLLSFSEWILFFHKILSYMQS